MRKWFSHDPENGLSSSGVTLLSWMRTQNSWAPIQEAARHGPVTLIFSSHDPDHNNAVVLKEYLDKKLNLRS